MEEARVAVLVSLNSGVPTYPTVPLLEAHRSLGTQRLPYGDLAAVGEALPEKVETDEG